MFLQDWISIMSISEENNFLFLFGLVCGIGIDMWYGYGVWYSIAYKVLQRTCRGIVVNKGSIKHLLFYIVNYLYLLCIGYAYEKGTYYN